MAARRGRQGGGGGGEGAEGPGGSGGLTLQVNPILGRGRRQPKHHVVGVPPDVSCISQELESRTKGWGRGGQVWWGPCGARGARGGW